MTAGTSYVSRFSRAMQGLARSGFRAARSRYERRRGRVDTVMRLTKYGVVCSWERTCAESVRFLQNGFCMINRPSENISILLV